MASTTNGLPYPTGSDTFDPPGDIQDLAVALDTVLNAASVQVFTASGTWTKPT